MGIGGTAIKCQLDTGAKVHVIPHHVIGRFYARDVKVVKTHLTLFISKRIAGKIPVLDG